MKKKLLLLLVSLFLIPLGLAAQSTAIKGSVKDASGEPIIGATVRVVGYNNIGAATDLNGNFSVNAPADARQLEVSYIGMLTRVIDIVKGAPVNITLEEDAEQLSEVVMIGYQAVKRKDLTGSVSSITAKDITAVPVPNVAQALQGQMPGVSITSQDGRPGASISIRVRGGGSITQSNEPLLIVDGITVSSIDDIPGDNIESIDVLKDAAATAIYGARGANGVVLVTTKGGTESKPTVRYNMYYQYKENPKMLDVLDAEDYVFWNWAYATAYGESYGDGVAQYFGLGSAYGNHLSDYDDVESHNYINDVMKAANTWNHDISLSGGNANTKYYTAINYLNDDGIRINSGFKRWNANFKLTQKISNKLMANFDLRYTNMNIIGTQYDRATSAYAFRAIDNPLGDGLSTHFGNGNTSVEEAYNPVDLIKNYENYVYRQRLRGTAGLTWNVFKGFTAKSELSLGTNWNETDYWNNGNNPSDTAYKLAKLTKSDGNNVHWTNTLNYEIQGLPKDHSFSILAGHEILSSVSDNSVIQGAGYPAAFSMKDAFGMINMTDPTIGKDVFSNTYGTPSHTVSFFGRANYAYKGRYLLTGTFRADGSSKFAPNNHWGYFPAAAAAWRISDEPWMNNSKSWLDDLKLRLSYGASGADNIDPSLWKETWRTKDIMIDGVSYTGYVPGDMLSNPDLKWETTISRNVGVDFSILNRRLRGNVDAYWNTTKDILMKVPCDASSGYSYQFQNVAQTSNKGIEVGLTAELVKHNNFGLNFIFSYSFNKNNVDKILADITPDTHTGWGSTMRKPYYDYIIREGQPVGTVQGYMTDGFYTIDDFNYVDGKYILKEGVPDFQGSIVNYPDGMKALVPEGQTAFPGAAKFKNQNDNPNIDDDDLTVIGHMLPEHMGGFGFNGYWKSFDFAANFTYQIGGCVYNANAMHSMMGNKDNQLGENRLFYVEDCVRAYNTDSKGDLYLITDPNEWNQVNADAKYALPYSEYGICTSDWLEDASFLRLQNLTVGYTLPKKFTNSFGCQSLRVYVTGTNLFCLSSYSGLDPDVNTNTNAGGDGFPTPYYDYNSYPKARSYSFGLNLTF